MSTTLDKWRSYIPLHYAFRFKRNKSTGLPFFADNLGDDFLLILLAFVPFSSNPITIALAIFLFHISFWIVYEIGYFENDAMSAAFEHEAKVTEGFHEAAEAYSETMAWIWAIGVALPGAALAAWVVTGPQMWLFAPLYLTGWSLLLVALRGLYYLYNRIDKLTRVWLYLPLQILKYGFPVLFFPLPAAGAALVLAQSMRRWVPYIVYRFGFKQNDLLPSRVLRIVVFAAMWLLLLHSNMTFVYLLHGGAILVWLCIRGQGQVRRVLSGACHVRDDKWSTASRGDRAE